MSPEFHPLSASFFLHCPRCGAAVPPGANGALFTCAACNLVYHFNPAIAAAVFVVDPQERVLLIRRQKEPSKGMLAIPGGFIDMGEQAEVAARREVWEETGVEIGALRFLASHPNHYPYKGILYPVLDFFFVARVDSQALDNAHPRDEVLEILLRRKEEVNVEDLAFASMKAAWGDFVRLE